jgi:hypothetical protein
LQLQTGLLYSSQIFILLVKKMPALSTLLEKYGDILKEEINVKELDSFVSDTPIIRVFKPL